MELFDLDKLNQLSLKEQIDIKKRIIETTPLRLIPPDYLPPVHTKKYYFISYSHKDYKEVYSDIFDFQQKGLSVWYDQGIAAGDNWKDTAEKYMMPFECRGVVFYISENALKSKAIKAEIEFAKSTGKPFIVILISDNKELSLNYLIEKLYSDGVIGKSEFDFYKRMFPNEIIYIRYEDIVQNKVKLIKGSLKKQPILELDTFSSSLVVGNIEPEDLLISNKFKIVIRGLYDYYAKEVLISDFFELLSNPRVIKSFLLEHYKRAYLKSVKESLLVLLKKKPIALSAENVNGIEIGQAAFSNMKNLQYAEIPLCDCSNYGFNYIFDYAFFGCKKLTEIKFVSIGETFAHVEIGKCAFNRCDSLRKFDFSRIENFGEYSFCLCTSLEEVDLSNNEVLAVISAGTFQNCNNLKKVTFNEEIVAIDDYAFCDTSIEKIILPKDLDTIGSYAFGFCRALKEILFKNKISIIERGAFFRCDSLKTVHLPRSLTSISPSAFGNCKSLVKVFYNGTSKRLMEITQNKIDECFWSKENNIEIMCRDKTIFIEKKNDES